MIYKFIKMKFSVLSEGYLGFRPFDQKESGPSGIGTGIRCTPWG
jgi:hypothetical protein